MEMPRKSMSWKKGSAWLAEHPEADSQVFWTRNWELRQLKSSRMWIVVAILFGISFILISFILQLVGFILRAVGQ